MQESLPGLPSGTPGRPGSEGLTAEGGAASARSKGPGGGGPSGLPSSGHGVLSRGQGRPWDSRKEGVMWPRATRHHIPEAAEAEVEPGPDPQEELPRPHQDAPLRQAALGFQPPGRPVTAAWSGGHRPLIQTWKANPLRVSEVGRASVTQSVNPTHATSTAAKLSAAIRQDGGGSESQSLRGPSGGTLHRARAGDSPHRVEAGKWREHPQTDGHRTPAGCPGQAEDTGRH